MTNNTLLQIAELFLNLFKTSWKLSFEYFLKTICFLKIFIRLICLVF